MLVVLRQGWDHVDQYTRTARYYKRFSKSCFIVLLVLSVLNTLAIVLSTQWPEPELWPKDGTRLAVLVISILLTLVTATFAFVKPVQKWHQLKSAALELESEIW